MAQNRTPSLLYFMAGLSLGAAIGMLMSPGSGVENRRRLVASAHSGREFLEKTREIYEQGKRLAEEAAEMVEEGRRLVEHES